MMEPIAMSFRIGIDVGGTFTDFLARVRDDVQGEYVSREAACEQDGVVLTGEIPDYSLELDAQASRALRERTCRERAS